MRSHYSQAPKRTTTLFANAVHTPHISLDLVVVRRRREGRRRKRQFLNAIENESSIKYTFKMIFNISRDYIFIFCQFHGIDLDFYQNLGAFSFN